MTTLSPEPSNLLGHVPQGESGVPPASRTNLMAQWHLARGVSAWFREINTLEIGKRTIVTALVFFALAGIEALLMRIQLAKPDNTFLGPDRYNQLFTTHGSTMMFLFAVPVMQGLGIYLVPLMLGTRSLTFPRLASYGYHVYLIGGLFLYVALFSNTGPDAGWFSYVPLAGPQFSAGKRVDVWSQLVTFTELSALATAVNLIVTTFKMRAPRMAVHRIPLFVWAQLVTSFMVIFAMPAVMVGSAFLAMDRLVGTQFFNPAEHGDPLLYQHLFWFFGHPEVYIIFVPALGIVSSIVETFARRPVVGYLAMVSSLVITGLMAFGLWVHHMFATGLPQIGESFFTAASMMIAVPTGVQIFCWIATLWTGKLNLKTPLLFVFGFIFTFVLGGMSGLVVASVPLDLQVHDTFFVVAHLHYVLIGGSVFPLFGGLYYWFPKFSGRLLDERLGVVNFLLLLIGFHLTFFPMHILGLHGMTRRVYTYRADTGFADLNLLATIGAFVLGLGVLCFVINVIYSLRRGERASEDPWGGSTLEWSAASPPAPYVFERLHAVNGLHPRWEEPGEPVVGLREDRREVLVTRAFDGVPDHRYELPGPSAWPFFAAAATGVTFIGLIFTPWAFVVGVALIGIALIGWFWPRRGPQIRDELLEQQP